MLLVSNTEHRQFTNHDLIHDGEKIPALMLQPSLKSKTPLGSSQSRFNCGSDKISGWPKSSAEDAEAHWPHQSTIPEGSTISVVAANQPHEISWKLSFGCWRFLSQKLFMLRWNHFCNGKLPRQPLGSREWSSETQNVKFSTDPMYELLVLLYSLHPTLL